MWNKKLFYFIFMATFLTCSKAFCLILQLGGNYYTYNYYTGDWDIFYSTEANPLMSGSTNYIQHSTAPTGGVFNVSSGTIENLNATQAIALKRFSQVNFGDGFNIAAPGLIRSLDAGSFGNYLFLVGIDTGATNISRNILMDSQVMIGFSTQLNATNIPLRSKLNIFPSSTLLGEDLILFQNTIKDSNYVNSVGAGLGYSFNVSASSPSGNIGGGVAIFNKSAEGLYVRRDNYRGPILFSVKHSSFNNLGSVGIGPMIIPTATLDVAQSSTSPNFYLRNSSSGFNMYPSSGINFVESAGVNMLGAADLRFGGKNSTSVWVTFSSNENVGIGLSSPTQKLDVLGNIAVTGTVDGRDISADGARLDLISNATAYNSILEGNTTAYININDIFQVKTGSVAFMGGISIGTAATNSSRKLEIKGDEWIQFSASTATRQWHINNLSGNGGLNFAETGVADGRLFIAKGGFIGVGTTSPRSKIEIAGGTLLIPNNTAIQGRNAANTGSIDLSFVGGDDSHAEAFGAAGIGFWRTGDSYKMFMDGTNFNLALGGSNPTPTSRLDVINGSITVRGTNAGINIAGLDIVNKFTGFDLFFPTASAGLNGYWLNSATTTVLISSYAARLNNLDGSTATLTTAINAAKTAISTNAVTTASQFSAAFSSISTLQTATATLAGQIAALNTSTGNFINTTGSTQTKSGSLILSGKLNAGTTQSTYTGNFGGDIGLYGNRIQDAYFIAKATYVFEDCLGSSINSGTLISTAVFDAVQHVILLHPPGASTASGNIEYTLNIPLFEFSFDFVVQNAVGSPNRVAAYAYNSTSPNSDNSISGGYVWTYDIDSSNIVTRYNGVFVTSVSATMIANTTYTAKITYNAASGYMETWLNGVRKSTFTDTQRNVTGTRMGILGIVVSVPTIIKTRNILINRINGISGYQNGSVLFGYGGTVEEDNGAFYYDKLRRTLALGTSIATSALDVVGGSISVRGSNAGINISGIDVLSAISSTSTFSAKLNSTQTFTGGNTFSSITVRSGQAGISIKDNGTSSGFNLAQDSLGGASLTNLPGSMSYYAGTSGGHYFYVNNDIANPKMLLGPNGKLITGDVLNQASSQLEVFNGSITVRGTNAGINVVGGGGLFSGNVGVGKSAPTTALDVLGALHISTATALVDNGYNGALRITRGAASGQYINLTRYGNYVWSLGTVYNSNTFGVGGGQATDSDFTSPFLNIQTDGNVGIGTTIPSYKLDVVGDMRGSPIVRQNGTYTNGSIYSDSNWGMLFRSAQISPGLANFAFADSSDNKLLTINPSGNVGVGTGSPFVKFEVASGSISVQTGSSFMIKTNDQFHGLKFAANDWDTTNVDGPVLFGWAGGRLGTMSGGKSSILSWTSVGVGIGTTVPNGILDISTKSASGAVTYIRNTGAFAGAYTALLIGNDTNLSKLAFFTNSSSRTLDGGAGNSTIRTDSGDLILGAASAEIMRLSAGNVGVGRTPTMAKLEVSGDIGITNNTGLGWFTTGGNFRYMTYLRNDDVLRIGNDAGDGANGVLFVTETNSSQMYLSNSGNTGLNTTTPKAQLQIFANAGTAGNFLWVTTGTANLFEVNGSSIVGRVPFYQTASAYSNPDYVFETGYKLRSLAELSAYIKKEKHLPGMFSDADIKKAGMIDSLEQQRRTIEKLEEAYLYILQLEKRIAKLEAQTK